MPQPVTALIADDEAVARTGLRDMLADYDWVSVVGEAESGPAAVTAIEALGPDLVFLDIQMPGLLGTDVLRHVRRQPVVIFTTAWARHAVTAFELGALDYLLKPFGPERLGLALQRARAALGDLGGEPALNRLQEVQGQGPISRLFIRSGGGVVSLPVADVSWFEARGDYVAVHAGRSRHLLHLALSQLEARLDPSQFLRVHRSHIVNLDRVKAFRREGRGLLVAHLDDGTRLPVSRMRARALRGLAT